MSLRKRARALDDTGDTEIEIASSSLRHSQAKRSRVSLAAENGGSTVSDEESDVEDNQSVDEVPNNASSPPHSDADSEDDDEVHEIQATQYIQRNRRQHAENIAAEEGIIEEVFCRNFMCHTKLRIRLGPLINFIIGHNGSGKSAVLTALTMCLGGKATATNRGASLKSLIKEGQENATLAVKIKNRGDNAYKPEVYGGSIIVERHFSRSGTSGFKIKNADERIITTKKADLDDILDFFAFQLDNPINVLTQDMARQFLSNSSASEKYKFFIKGTQLETLNGDYKLIEEHQNNMEEKLELREDDLKILEQKSKDAEAKKKRLDGAQAIQDKLKSLERMHAWAQVQEQEALLSRFEDALVGAQRAVQDKESAAEDAAGRFEGHSQAMTAAENAMASLKEPIASLSEDLASAKESFDSNTQELLTVNAEQRTIRDSLKRHKEEVKKLELDVVQEQNRLEGAAGPAHAQRLEELEMLTGTAEEAKQAYLEHEGCRATLEQTRQITFAAVQDSEAKLTQAKNDSENAKSRLATLNREQGRKYAGYPERMEDLVRDIARETRWRTKPVGPFGLHIKIVKPEWSSIIETTLGGSLNSFAVTNQDDQKLLNALLRKHNSQSSIFIGSDRPIDTRNNQPSEDVDTILSVLRIDNELVRNTLVINHYVEQTVLIADQSEATDFMFSSGQRQHVRATIAMASRGAGTRYEHTRGGQKASPVRAWAGLARLQIDRDDQLRIQQDRVQAIQKDYDSAEQERRRCVLEHKKAQEALVRWKRHEVDLKASAQRAEDDVEAKNIEIENHKPQDGRLQELERQLVEAKEGQQSDSASYQDSVNAKDRLDTIAAERKAFVDNAQSALDEAQKRLTKAEKRAIKVGEDRMRALLEKNEAFAAVESSKESVEQAKARKDAQQDIVDDYIRQATEVSQRVPVEEGLTIEALDHRIKTLTDQLERAERQAGGSREDLTRAWMVARKEFVQAKKQWRDMDKLNQTLKRTLAERQKRWKRFRQYISARAKSSFSYLLSERSFRGRVLMDHRSKLLDISVEPDISKVSDAGRQAKTLSGGEKSFSTICLLLSIWEAIGSPIRCLDEFDVFMDSVNRSTSMTMMIQAARRAVGKQFVLITPQAMNNVEMGDDVRVHRMSDPERGQTALGFGA